jgi:hypothetical protein
LDQPLEQILGAKLPTKSQTLRHFLYHIRVQKRSIDEAAKETVSGVLIFWEKAGIATKKRQHCIKSVKNLYNDYKVRQ